MSYYYLELAGNMSEEQAQVYLLHEFPEVKEILADNRKSRFVISELAFINQK